jgi:hypothetical protein
MAGKALGLDVKLWGLWIGILAGPVAWALDEVIGYSVTHHECSTGHRFLLHLLTVGALILTGFGFMSSWNVFQGLSSGSGANGIALHRSRFMAKAGMLLSACFLLVIIATAIPKWMLSPCD